MTKLNLRSMERTHRAMLDESYHAGQEARHLGLARTPPFTPSGPFAAEWWAGWDDMDRRIKNTQPEKGSE
jgi:hypothetical protein